MVSSRAGGAIAHLEERPLGCGTESVPEVGEAGLHHEVRYPRGVENIAGVAITEQDPAPVDEGVSHGNG